MKTLTLGAVLGLMGLGLGCGGDSSGDEANAFLTIVGSADLAVDAEASVPLTVRYHDADDQPLAGKISFRLDGADPAVTLSTASSTANADGEVTIDLRLGRGAALEFKVVAEALGAEPAVWSVSRGKPDLRFAGQFELDSRFVVGALPEAQFGAIAQFIEMTDDPNDPATWILDRLTADLDDPFQSILELARPAIDVELNASLFEQAPGFLTGLTTLGDELGQITETLGLASVLDTRGTDPVEGESTAIHSVLGATFWLDGDAHAFTRQQMGLAPMTTQGVIATLGTLSTLTIKRHAIAMPYGKMLNYAVDQVVVPRHSATADNLAELVAGLVDCQGIGQSIADELDFGPAELYTSACMNVVADATAGLATPFGEATATLEIAGTARTIDGNGNYDVDALVDGLWDGALVFDQAEVILAKPDQTFEGSRVGVDPR